jgi:hypothetical protein
MTTMLAWRPSVMEKAAASAGGSSMSMSTGGGGLRLDRSEIDRSTRQQAESIDTTELVAPARRSDRPTGVDGQEKQRRRLGSLLGVGVG